jgi:hypothetical protein
VICRVKLDEEKSKHAGFGSGKYFWLSIVAQIAVAHKRRSNLVQLNKSV